MEQARQYRLWIYVRPAADLDGQWCGHCLDLNVVSQGGSLAEAFKMTIEAAAMVLEDDLNRGADPLDRRAPAKYWARWAEFMASAKRVPLKKAIQAECMVAWVPFVLVQQQVKPESAEDVDEDSGSDEVVDGAHAHAKDPELVAC